MVNEIVPVQQVEAYRKPTQKAVKEAVKELNPDTNSFFLLFCFHMAFLFLVFYFENRKQQRIVHPI